ncbi:Spore coat protein Z OS=Ureibacillus acetophenoni OX=614649 GN=SAMN05877842_101260 PE=4 SV=1 [Ureibacillus acetophenoni]
MGCGRKSESSSFHGEHHHDNRGCICEVVKSILKIQNAAVRNDDDCGTSCFLEPLGGLSHRRRGADTRVFMLLDKLGKPFKVVARKGDEFFFTPFFRVEDVFGDCCATLRALAPIKEHHSPAHDPDIVDNIVDEGTDNLDPDKFDDIKRFKKTETCVTVDLNNFTAIQCVADEDLFECM